MLFCLCFHECCKRSLEAQRNRTHEPRVASFGNLDSIHGERPILERGRGNPFFAGIVKSIEVSLRCPVDLTEWDRFTPQAHRIVSRQTIASISRPPRAGLIGRLRERLRSARRLSLAVERMSQVASHLGRGANCGEGIGTACEGIRGPAGDLRIKWIRNFVSVQSPQSLHRIVDDLLIRHGFDIAV